VFTPTHSFLNRHVQRAIYKDRSLLRSLAPFRLRCKQSVYEYIQFYVIQLKLQTGQTTLLLLPRASI
jgi:hypothetical protein